MLKKKSYFVCVCSKKNNLSVLLKLLHLIKPLNFIIFLRVCKRVFSFRSRFLKEILYETVENKIWTIRIEGKVEIKQQRMVAVELMKLVLLTVKNNFEIQSEVVEILQFVLRTHFSGERKSKKYWKKRWYKVLKNSFRYLL